MIFNNIFDTHAHYDDDSFQDDISETMDFVFSNGVSTVINCGCTVRSSIASIELSNKYPGKVYAAVGIHPLDAAEEGIDSLTEIRKLSEDPSCVAIGEIGLDYHYDSTPIDLQNHFFEKQLILANSVGLPVIIHDREAHADCLKHILKHRPIGVMHCYSGSLETAKQLIDAGLYIGIGGSVTFKNAVKPKQVAKEIPLERLLLETDCPYMAPVPFRGKRNNSAYISYVAETIAELRDIEPQTVIDIASENARRLFLTRKGD